MDNDKTEEYIYTYSVEKCVNYLYVFLFLRLDFTIKYVFI